MVLPILSSQPEPRQEDFEDLAEFAKALGHPHRVAIVRYLYKSGGCICGDLVNVLPIAQSTVSQHLKKLKEASWIQGEIEGPRTCYCLTPTIVARFRELFDQLFDTKKGKENTEMKITRKEDIRTVVRDRYGKAATGESCCGTSGCCGSAPASLDQIAAAIGYRDEDIAVIPEGANLGLGCGNPLQYADVKFGETVLDLGSGAGIDAFLAAKMVGPTGHVIGVDMTPEMLSKARENAEQVNATNVEFRLGEIEHLPVPDNSVDLIISNCVINLSPEKPQVFSEAYRVLKPGGRALVSDLVLKRSLSEGLKHSVEAYVGCVAGASLKEEYLTLMREAGFKNVEIVDEQSYDVGLDALDNTLQQEALAAVLSVKVRGTKASS